MTAWQDMESHKETINAWLEAEGDNYVKAYARKLVEQIIAWHKDIPGTEDCEK